MYMKLVPCSEITGNDVSGFVIFQIYKFSGFVNMTAEIDKLQNDYPGIVIVQSRKFDNPEKIRGFECHCVFVRKPEEQEDPIKFRAICSALMQRMRAPGADFPRNLYVGV